MKNRIIPLSILILTLAFQSTSSFASHIFGGDISYRCLENNQYEITFTLYQDCLNGEPSAIAQDNPSFFSIFNAATNSVVLLGSTGNYISQQIVPTGFTNDCITNYPNTCMQKTVFRFNVTLPPTTAGYIFVYQRCCRNQFISNIYAPGTTGTTFTATIPPFINNICSNNSAKFNNNPPQIICRNNPFSFDFSATDIDGDSLSYELCNAYIGGSPSDPVPGSGIGNSGPIQAPPYTPVSWIPPYDFQYPIPSSPAFTIDPTSGTLTGTPTESGRYVFSVCVNEWRNGQVINTLRRDLQFVITDCSKAVIANLPSLSFEPDVYVSNCDSTFSIFFQNTSVGGFNYFWDFGDPTTLADTSNLQFPTYVYPDTGVYIVKLVVNRGSTCPDSTERKVKLYPVFRVNFDIDGKLCAGEPIAFTDKSTSTFPTINSWTWHFDDGTTSTLQNPIHVFPSNKDSFEIKLVSTTSKGCYDSTTKTFIIPQFMPFAGNDTVVIVNDQFNMNGSGGNTYQWTPTNFLTDPSDAKSSITIPIPGKYRYALKITNKENCIANDSVTITAASSAYFRVPTAFTPNGDGKNDAIYPVSAGFPDLIFFKIFDRWGNLVFQSFGSKKGGWDGTVNGKIAESGVYYWGAKARNAKGIEESFSGDITLIR